MAGKQLFRKRNKEASKATIIEAAITVFAKYGYDKATYKSISRISGLNESLITRYFGSKKGLAVATLDHVRHKCFEATTSEEPKETFAEEFHALGTYLTEIYNKNVNNIVALFLLIPADTTLNEDACKEELLKMPNGDRLRIYREKGELPPDIDLDKLMRNMLILMHSVLYFQFLVMRIPIKNAERLLHFNIDSFIYGIRPENKSLHDISSVRAETAAVDYERRKLPRGN